MWTPPVIPNLAPPIPTMAAPQYHRRSLPDPAPPAARFRRRPLRQPVAGRALPPGAARLLPDPGAAGQILPRRPPDSGAARLYQISAPPAPTAIYLPPRPALR
jgi:hypothetical protein